MDQRRRGAVTVQEAREACIAPGTRDSYISGIKQITKWIRRTQADPDRFFDANGELDVEVFTPKHFEVFAMARFNDTEKPVKVSTISGYRIAIKHIYRLRRLPVPAAYEEDLKTTFSGLDRIENHDLQRGAARETGKRPLPYSEYKTLCAQTLQLKYDGFTHLFLTTQWNLMCRSASTETVHTTHLVSADDSVGCVLHKTKTNQAAHGPKDPRHIYANRMSPATCWVTALGFYFACHPTQSPGPVFPGSNQKKRFSKSIKNLLDIRSDSKLYGTHSIRKGVATFACSGSTGGPSIVSVCLRCGWSLGDIQDRYFRYEAAGDQYLGRVVAGLPVNNCEFAVLPPHFQDPRSSFVESCLAQMFPALINELQLKPILQLCLASLVYHAPFFFEELPPSHSLLATFIFREPQIMAQLTSNLVSGDSDWMMPTGIPPHIELYRQQQRTQKAVEDLPQLLLDGMGALLDDRGARSGNITMAVLQDAIANALVTAQLRPPTSSVEPRPRPPSPQGWKFLKGKCRLLPDKFTLPSVDTFTAWKLWWFGNPAQSIPPYRSIPSHEIQTEEARKTYSEWTRMMKLICDGVESRTGARVPTVLTEEEATRLHDEGMKALPVPAPSQGKRDLKICTVLKLISEAQKSMRPGYVRRPYKRRKRQRSTAGEGGSTT